MVGQDLVSAPLTSIPYAYDLTMYLLHRNYVFTEATGDHFSLRSLG